jgi:phosphatidylglycerophosphate synthase
MPSKLRVKKLFRPLVQLLAKSFRKVGITPNQVTAMGLIFAVIGCIFFIIWADYYGALFFALFIFLAGIFDGVDGTLARLINKTSVKGGYMDSVLDRYADIGITVSFLGHYPTGFTILGHPLFGWIIFGIIGITMVSYTRAKMEAMGGGDSDVGLMGRSERLFILFISALLNYAYVGLLIVAILSHLTALYRIHHAYRLLKSLTNQNYE